MPVKACSKQAMTGLLLCLKTVDSNVHAGQLNPNIANLYTPLKKMIFTFTILEGGIDALTWAVKILQDNSFDIDVSHAGFGK